MAANKRKAKKNYKKYCIFGMYGYKNWSEYKYYERRYDQYHVKVTDGPEK